LPRSTERSSRRKWRAQLASNLYAEVNVVPDSDDIRVSEGVEDDAPSSEVVRIRADHLAARTLEDKGNIVRRHAGDRDSKVKVE
jgi:hypothetical protein